MNFPFNNKTTDRVDPQDGQGIFVTTLNGQRAIDSLSNLSVDIP
ncbi:MAG: hypothetical protein PF517_16065 [Salinivirgaceae bacterium]|nr:hypothetical protein [Salinivirgaceae bacterium]